MEAMFTVVTKVLIILILIFVGYIISKKGIITDKGINEITSLLIKVVTPCLIINSFMNAKGNLEPITLLLAVVIPLISTAVSIVFSIMFFRKEPIERKTVLRFSVMFGNVGFMGVPLVESIVGETAVIYAAFAIVVFNIVCWTYGIRVMNSEAKINFKTLFLNPGIIGVIIGFPLYFINFQMPEIISEPISALSGLNTPLAMIVIGSYIAKIDFRSFVSDISVYKMSVLRLLIIPAITLVFILLLHPEQDLFMTGAIQAAMPVAANTVLFAVIYKKDSELASKSVAVSTVLSIVTIPVFTILAQTAINMFY